MKKIIFKFWIYILKTIHEKEVDKIYICQEPHVVYFDAFKKEMYICPNGSHAIQLVETLTKLHKLTNISYIKILHGKADDVFKYKMFKVLDCVFTWNCPEEEKRKLFAYMADTPIRNLEENKNK